MLGRLDADPLQRRGTGRRAAACPRRSSGARFHTPGCPAAAARRRRAAVRASPCAAAGSSRARRETPAGRGLPSTIAAIVEVGIEAQQRKLKPVLPARLAVAGPGVAPGRGQDRHHVELEIHLARDHCRQRRRLLGRILFERALPGPAPSPRAPAARQASSSVVERARHRRASGGIEAGRGGRLQSKQFQPKNQCLLIRWPDKPIRLKPARTSTGGGLNRATCMRPLAELLERTTSPPSPPGSASFSLAMPASVTCDCQT